RWTPVAVPKRAGHRELDEELKGFLEMAAEEKVKQGMNRKDALRAVRLESGYLEVTKETVRSAGWEFVLETCCQDLRYAFRTLRKRDRKSTRLNSSHVAISYAVFCLKKKKKKQNIISVCAVIYGFSLYAL